MTTPRTLRELLALPPTEVLASEADEDEPLVPYTPLAELLALEPVEGDLDYPESDGNLMAENTEQFAWIVLIKENLEILFRDNPLVFVAGDLLWYPIKGNNRLRFAPDAMVVFGRPKGRRGSYMQWVEDGLPPQVVFEVRSPGNRAQEMADKLHFYDLFGVEEYYLYDPDTDTLDGWLRDGARLRPIPILREWVSPRLGIRFDVSSSPMRLYHPDGRAFLSSIEREEWLLAAEQRAAAEQAARTDAELRAAQAEQRAAAEQAARTDAEQRAAQAEQRAAIAEQRATAELAARAALEAELARMREQLRQLGREEAR